MLKLLSLSLIQLRRELKSGDWLIIFFALVLAVSAITTLYFYTDRIERGLYQQSAKILGGDLLITSSIPLPPEWISHATQLNIKSAEVWSYPTMIRYNNQLQLVNLLAVSKNYPLFDESIGRPTENSIWIEPRLFSLMSLRPNDEVSIGVATFQVISNIPSALDTFNTGWLIAPKVIMRLEDTSKTKTVIPGSNRIMMKPIS